MSAENKGLDVLFAGSKAVTPLAGYQDEQEGVGLAEDACAGEAEEDALAAEAAQADEAVKPLRRRRAPGKLSTDNPPQTIYEAVEQLGLLTKLTDICLSAVKMPWHLRDDGAAQIHWYWATLAVNPSYEPNQIANYAYLSGKHAALTENRQLSAAVTIPAALFRAKKPSEFLKSIGAAVNPKDIDEYQDSMELSVDPSSQLQAFLASEAGVDLAWLERRVAGISLTPSQRGLVVALFVERKTVEQLADESGESAQRLRRQITKITRAMESKNQRIDLRMQQRQAQPHLKRG